jgi:hypothetical protein
MALDNLLYDCVDWFNQILVIFTLMMNITDYPMQKGPAGNRIVEAQKLLKLSIEA